MNRWVEFVKQFARANNISYPCAVSNPECKRLYKESKHYKLAKNVVELEQAYPEYKPKGLKIYKRVNPVEKVFEIPELTRLIHSFKAEFDENDKKKVIEERDDTLDKYNNWLEKADYLLGEKVPYYRDDLKDVLSVAKVALGLVNERLKFLIKKYKLKKVKDEYVYHEIQDWRDYFGVEGELFKDFAELKKFPEKVESIKRKIIKSYISIMKIMGISKKNAMEVLNKKYQND